MPVGVYPNIICYILYAVANPTVGYIVYSVHFFYKS